MKALIFKFEQQWQSRSEPAALPMLRSAIGNRVDASPSSLEANLIIN
jgi:hypothetical protein